MTFHVQLVVAVVLGGGVAWARPVVDGSAAVAEGQTTVAFDLTGGTARDTLSARSFSPITYPDLASVNDRQLITALSATHERPSGLRFGVRLGHVSGEGPPPEARRAIDTAESRAALFEEAASYNLFAASALVGYRGDRAGVDLAIGTVVGPEGAILRPGIRGLWGDLSLTDGDMKLWFETTWGAVDSLPEITQFGLGGGLGGRLLTLRVGFEAANLPTYDPEYCDGCVGTAADAGGPYVDATVHMGPVNLRVKGVYRTESRGLVGLGFVF